MKHRSPQTSQGPGASSLYIAVQRGANVQLTLADLYPVAESSGGAVRYYLNISSVAPLQREEKLSYVKILDRNPAILGTPEGPSPSGFLALIQAGPDVWNEWRMKHPPEWDEKNHIWLRAVKWRDDYWAQSLVLKNYPNIKFTGLHFGDGANFAGQLFPDDRMTRFDGSFFGDDANFSEANGLSAFGLSPMATPCNSSSARL